MNIIIRKHRLFVAKTLLQVSKKLETMGWDITNHWDININMGDKMKHYLLPVVVLVFLLSVAVRVFGAYDIEIYAINQDESTLMIKSELTKLLSNDDRFNVTNETSDLKFQELVLADTTYLIPEMEFEDFPYLVSVDTKSMGDSKQLLVSTTMFIEGVIIDSEIYSTSHETANQIVGMIKTVAHRNGQKVYVNNS